MKTNEITEKIIGCAYQVHNTLGSGFLEKVYENAMCIEIGKSGLKVVQQRPIEVLYDDVVVGEYFIDLFVEDLAVVELKASHAIHDAHLAQGMHYLKALGLEIGLLINFGKSVQVKRVINSLVSSKKKPPARKTDQGDSAN
jgi:GxxExxY protein